MSVTKFILERAMDMVKVASDDPTRLNITGVYIVAKENKVTLTATDGCMLLTREFAGNWPDGEYTLRREELPALKALLKESKHIQEIECAITADKGLLLGSFAVKVTLAAMSDQYPDYKRVIPSYEQPCAIAFDAEFLAAIAKCLQDGDRRHQSRVIIEFDPKDPDRPVLVHGFNPDTAGVGVIMPLHCDRAKTISGSLRARLEENTEEVA